MNRTVEVHIPEEQLEHAATSFIHAANAFPCYILVTRGGNSVNAKSLLGFLSLGMRDGVQVELSAEGPDAEKAIDTLASILEYQ